MINLPKNSLSFLQHQVCHFQIFRWNTSGKLTGTATPGRLLQRIHRYFIRKLYTFRNLLPKSDSFPHDQIFLVIFFLDSDDGIVIQYLADSVHPLCPHSLRSFLSTRKYLLQTAVLPFQSLLLSTEKSSDCPSIPYTISVTSLTVHVPSDNPDPGA